MTIDYFPHSISKAAFTCLSCRHYHNVRVKYQKMNTFIQDEIVNKILYEHHLASSSPTITTSPGAVLLPTPYLSPSSSHLQSSAPPRTLPTSGVILFLSPLPIRISPLPDLFEPQCTTKPYNTAISTLDNFKFK